MNEMVSFEKKKNATLCNIYELERKFDLLFLLIMLSKKKKFVVIGLELMNFVYFYIIVFELKL